MTVTLQSGLKTTDIKPKIGSIVHADKEALLSGRHADEIRVLLEQRGVLVYPKINFSDEEQLHFTRTFGDIATEATGDDLFTISLDPTKSTGVEYLKGSLYWHFDGSMHPMPVSASILCSKVLSPPGTGNTEFANTYAAYDDLSDAEKSEVQGLKVIHNVWNSLLYYDPEPNQAKLEMFAKNGEVELPMVWTHRSGRKSLVLGCTARRIVGMDDMKSALLLNRLREWATSEPFHYAHVWSVGDMVMWDNTGTLHRARPYPLDAGRELHRTKLEGEEPITA